MDAENHSEKPNPIVVDPEMLSPETLDNVIDSFIMREGTDYGWQEISLEKKREQIRKQMTRHEISLVFDPGTESITLMTAHQLRKITPA